MRPVPDKPIRLGGGSETVLAAALTPWIDGETARRFAAEALLPLLLRERERGYGCPNGEACESCPCAAEDDVCFPGERLRAELVRERERADRQAEELRVIADTSEPGLRRAIARQSGELSARIVEIDALRERAEAAGAAMVEAERREHQLAVNRKVVEGRLLARAERAETALREIERHLVRAKSMLDYGDGRSGVREVAAAHARVLAAAGSPATPEPEDPR